MAGVGGTNVVDHDIASIDELAVLLRRLRRRHGRTRGDTPLTYRELAARTGWAHGIIGDYFSGKRLPPTDRFDVLVRLLGASTAEQGALATARDRVEENRRQPQVVTPRELPSDVSVFVGRETQLAALSGAAVTVLSGTAGVGKTALAVRWAHRVADRFPDGQLYVDLRGYADQAPTRPEQVLSGFLRSLGCRPADIPRAGPELAARYRSMLAGRRVLVLLDNAFSAEQVRPLLPGTPSCAVLVTSRDTLGGLVARDDARRVDLDRLTPDDANLLLHRLIGERAAAEPAAVHVLVARCAGLPLALRVAAEHASSRPDTPLRELVSGLSALDAGGDPETAVRTVLHWSYRHLRAGTAQAFRLLGLHPGQDFDVATVTVLTGADADRSVSELARAHLIEPRPHGRHGMHDLLREYAAELVAAEPADARNAAVRRLLTHYEETAETAGHALDGAGLAWLDAERANLVAAVGLGVPGFASRLSAALWRYLDSGGGPADQVLAIHEHALWDARRRGDRVAEGTALGRLGQAFGRLARYSSAIDHIGQSVAVSRAVGDPCWENAMLNSLAQIHGRLGDYEQAAECLERALAADRARGNRRGEATALGNLGIVHAQLGHYRPARQHFADALMLARLAGDANRVSEMLNNLGLVNCWLGAYDDAVSQLQQGLRSAREAGARAGEGRLHANLGVAYTGLGQLADAATSLARALAIHQETGDRAAEAETLTYLGDLRLREGQPHGALSKHDQALLIANEIGERNVQAAAHNGAGRALQALGRGNRARTRHERAREVAATIGDRLQEARALDGLSCHGRALEIYRELGVSPGEHGERLDTGAREDRRGGGPGWRGPCRTDQAARDQVVGRAEVTPTAVDRQVRDAHDDDLSAAVGDCP